MTDPFLTRWDEYKTRVDAALDGFLQTRRDLEPGFLEVLRYSVLGGGKRIRPVLAMAACEAAGGDPELAIPAGCALELIHAYSLVHDDMPCMDDDDLRRGRPTVHKKWDEAMAVLAGDALQAEAFLLVTDRRLNARLSAETTLDIAREVALAAGGSGMVGGQYIDIAARSRRLTRTEVETLHRLKTGALIHGAAVCGALAASATPSEIAALSRFGQEVGLLFQLTDDKLDAAELAETGQTPGDVNAAEAAVNFAVLLGDEALDEAIRDAAASAHGCVDVFAPRDAFLRGYVDRIATRTV